jgi:hypothetical protein
MNIAGVQQSAKRILENHRNHQWFETTEGVIATYFRNETVLNIYQGLDKSNLYIHSHPFDFTSTIVVGEMRHTRYQFRPEGAVYEFQRRRISGEFFGETERCGLEPLPVERYVAGDTYSILSHEIHSVAPADGTITLVVRDHVTEPSDFASYWPVEKPTKKVRNGSFAARGIAAESLVAEMVGRTLEAWILRREGD